MEAVNEQTVLELLSAIPDPELGIGIVDLGLIYGIEIKDQKVRVEMTMTTPACPLHAQLRQSIEDAIQARLPGVESVDVVLVWDPPWHPMLMSLDARRRLGWPA